MSQADDREWFHPAELLAAVGQAVIATQPDGTVVFWSAGAQRLYGWTAEEALGLNVAKLTVPVVSTEIAADIMAALRKGIAWSGGFPVRRKDGTVFPALVTDSGIYRDGELVGIVGISANLGTALRPLLERSTDAAVAVRADAVITYASPAVGPLFGWDEDAIIGSSIVPLVHAEDRDALAEFLTQVTRRPGPTLRSSCACGVRTRRGCGWRPASPTCWTTPSFAAWCATSTSAWPVWPANGPRSASPSSSRHSTHG